MLEVLSLITGTFCTSYFLSPPQHGAFLAVALAVNDEAVIQGRECHVALSAKFFVYVIFD